MKFFFLKTKEFWAVLWCRGSRSNLTVRRFKTRPGPFPWSLHVLPGYVWVFFPPTVEKQASYVNVSV